MDLGNVALLQDWASDPFFFVGGGGYNVPRHYGWSPNRGIDRLYWPFFASIGITNNPHKNLNTALVVHCSKIIYEVQIMHEAT